ncbi:hypothetical protein M5689_022262 [Euphorbia peplus]|nr:hypothetical protein M5689_022262 [Euphorbia peplus]
MDVQNNLIFFFLVILFKISQADQINKNCPPSSCGNIHNISYPFRLKTDPKSCGHDTYELSCENNSTVVLHLNDGVTKLNVKAINYDNYTIRVADPGVDEHDCSSRPRFTIFDIEDYHLTTSDRERQDHELTETISFIKCHTPVSSWRYMEIMGSCVVNSSGMMYNYAFRGLVNAYSDLRENCSIEMTSMLPARDFDLNLREKFVEIHREMAFGFEVSWYHIYCRKLNCSDGCFIDRTQGNQIGCADSKFGMFLLFSSETVICTYVK